MASARATSFSSPTTAIVTCPPRRYYFACPYTPGMGAPRGRTRIPFIVGRPGESTETLRGLVRHALQAMSPHQQKVTDVLLELRRQPAVPR